MVKVKQNDYNAFLIPFVCTASRTNINSMTSVEFSLTTIISSIWDIFCLFVLVVQNVKKRVKEKGYCPLKQSDLTFYFELFLTFETVCGVVLSQLSIK